MYVLDYASRNLLKIIFKNSKRTNIKAVKDYNEIEQLTNPEMEKQKQRKKNKNKKCAQFYQIKILNSLNAKKPISKIISNQLEILQDDIVHK